MLLLCLLLAPLAMLRAQPDVEVARLLFEPRPIPVDDSGNPSFTAVADLPGTLEGEAGTGTGQEAEERRAIQSSIDRYIAAVGDLEDSEGPFSDQLSEDLYAAGLLYQQLQDHEKALDFLIRAQNISRLNHGTETMEQIPMMEAMIESYHDNGDLKDADETFDGYLYLHQQAYGEDSLEAVSALNRLGDWNLQAFLERSSIALNIGRMNVQNFMMQNNLGGGSTAANLAMNMDDRTPESTPLFKLYQAQSNFLNAINILIQKKDFTHPELLDLERKLKTTYFLRTHQENIVYEPDFYLERKTSATGTRLDTSSQDRLNSTDYDSGLTSLQRTLAYISSNPERTPEQVANAMLEEADWHMLFERKVRGRETYEKAYEFFHQYPQMEAAIADLIYPAVPVVLPTFLPAPNSRERLGIAPDEDVNFFGYFDVSFSINRTGKARSIKIRDKGGEVTRNMEMRLNQYLRNVLFRPRFKDGKLDDGTLNLRYYVGY